MTLFIFVGDMLVMFFMVTMIVWLTAGVGKSRAHEISRIPLEDENYNG